MSQEFDVSEIRERIKKLLMRTEDRGATPAEAETAAKLIESLCAKYRLNADELAKEEAVERATLGRNATQWKGWIGNALAKRFRVKFEGSRVFSDSCQPSVQVTFSGEKHLAAVAAWLFRELCREVEAAGRRFKQRGIAFRGVRNTRKREFCKYAALAICRRLDPPREEVGSEPPSGRRTIAVRPENFESLRAGFEFGNSVSLATNGVGTGAAAALRIGNSACQGGAT